MEVLHEPAVRGRLNVLVQMFEKQSQTDEKSSSAPTRVAKLPVTKLQPQKPETTASPTASSEEERRSGVDTKFSVNSLIKTFDSVRRTPGPPKICNSSGDLRRRAAIPAMPTVAAPERFPEVKALLDEVFSRIQEFHRRTLSMDSRCSSDRDFTDDTRSFLTDSTDIESCVSSSDASSYVTLHNGGKIGALWTQDALADFECVPKRDVSGSDVHQLCTKKLSEYMDLLGSRVNSSADAKTSLTEECRAALSDTVKLVMSNNVHDEDDEGIKDAGAFERSLDFSVRTCKAMIEMTVFKGEALKPTINGANRAPCLTSSHDFDDLESQVLVSTDNPRLPSL